jgi:hypothetical protein
MQKGISVDLLDEEIRHVGPRGESAPTITGWRIDRAVYTAVPLKHIAR